MADQTPILLWNNPLQRAQENIARRAEESIFSRTHPRARTRRRAQEIQHEITQEYASEWVTYNTADSSATPTEFSIPTRDQWAWKPLEKPPPKKKQTSPTGAEIINSIKNKQKLKEVLYNLLDPYNQYSATRSGQFSIDGSIVWTQYGFEITSDSGARFNDHSLEATIASISHDEFDAIPGISHGEGYNDDATRYKETHDIPESIQDLIDFTQKQITKVWTPLIEQAIDDLIYNTIIRISETRNPIKIQPTVNRVNGNAYTSPKEIADSIITNTPLILTETEVYYADIPTS